MNQQIFEIIPQNRLYSYQCIEMFEKLCIPVDIGTRIMYNIKENDKNPTKTK